MQRRKKLARKTSLKPKVARPRKVNRKRRAANFARTYGGAYADYIRSLPCAALGGDCFGPIHAHHTIAGGMGRKADASTLAPLCARHHELWHTTAMRHWFGDRLRRYAAQLWARYQDERAA